MSRCDICSAVIRESDNGVCKECLLRAPAMVKAERTRIAGILRARARRIRETASKWMLRFGDEPALSVGAAIDNEIAAELERLARKIEREPKAKRGGKS